MAVLIVSACNSFIGIGRARTRCAHSIALWCLVIAIVGSSCGSSTASAQWLTGLLGSSAPPPVAPPSPPHPSVARVVVQESGGMSFGSGTLVDVRDNVGLLITNWHVVVDGTGPITVIFPSGFQSPARVLKTDKDWDLAALAIWKPDVPPVPLSAVAPVIGEPLAIAGYGSGEWRLAVGKCNQYVAPAQDLPYEMVEVSAEARQGDSGGPIFNARGELAGVLFGASRGTTSGSFSGRVRQFLLPILEGNNQTLPEAAANLAQNAAVPPATTNNVAHDNVAAAVSEPRPQQPSVEVAMRTPEPRYDAVAVDNVPAVESSEIARPASVPVYPNQDPPTPKELPRPTELAEKKTRWDDPMPGYTVEKRAVPLADTERNSDAVERIAAPLAQHVADNAEDNAIAPNAVDQPTTPMPVNAADEPRLASIAPTSRPVEHYDTADQGLVYTPLPPRNGASAPTSLNLPGLPSANSGAATSGDPWERLWKQLAGSTPFDQGKTILAALGVLTVLYRFLSRETTEEVVAD